MKGIMRKRENELKPEEKNFGQRQQMRMQHA